MDQAKRDLHKDVAPKIIEDNVTHDLLIEEIDFAKKNDYKLFMFYLGNESYVVTSKFNGKMFIHIRQYEMDSKRTVGYPTKLGITLSLENFRRFTNCLEVSIIKSDNTNVENL